MVKKDNTPGWGLDQERKIEAGIRWRTRRCVNPERRLTPRWAEYRAICHGTDGKHDRQPVTRVLCVGLQNLGAVRNRSPFTAIVGRGCGEALTFNTAIRSFHSHAETFEWPQKQKDCHCCHRYVKGTPHSFQYIR